MSELALIIQQLSQACTPEDVFGMPVDSVHSVYRRLAKVTHPDAYANGQRPAAEQAFKQLSRWWTLAQQKIASGTYGKRTVTVKTRRHEYVVDDQFATGDICNLYHATQDGSKAVIFKVARGPANNDLVTNEAQVLHKLGSDPFFPTLLDSFAYADASGVRRQVNVLDWTDKLYSLRDVRQAYPDGLDPRDMAWMFRRLLIALDKAHQHGLVHGAVLPTHVLIQPEQHGLVLVDWSYAVEVGQTISAVSLDYRAIYPADVFNKKPATFGLDLSMAAGCMVYLMDDTPAYLRRFFAGCMLKSSRPQDALALLGEFDDLIVRAWGPRKFRPFKMP